MNQSDAWYVLLPDGDVHRVTLDQLDEAFQAGHIDAETMVLAQGAERWTPLGRLAGLDDEPAPAFEPVSPPVVVGLAAYALAPTLPPGFHEQPAPGRVPVTNSFRPVSLDLSDVDLDSVSFRGNAGRNGKRFIAALVALSALGGVATVARSSHPYWTREIVSGADAVLSRFGVHALSAQPAQATQVTTPPVVAPEPVTAAPPPPAATPQPTPEAQAPAVSTTATSAQDANEKTSASDTKHESKAKAHGRGHGHAAHAVHTAPKVKGTGFTTGSNKYDPLNSSI